MKDSAATSEEAEISTEVAEFKEKLVKCEAEIESNGKARDMSIFPWSSFSKEWYFWREKRKLLSFWMREVQKFSVEDEHERMADAYAMMNEKLIAF